MATIKDVRLWLVASNIGHIVSSTRGDWNFLLCDKMIVGEAQTGEPGRKCRACMARLERATVIEDAKK